MAADEDRTPSERLTYPGMIPESELAIDPFVLTTAMYTPGGADDFYASIDRAESRAICRAELLYYRGDPEGAADSVRGLDSSDDLRIRLGVFLINAVTSIARGSVDNILRDYFGLKKLDSIIKADPSLSRTGDFFSLYFNILVHNPGGIRLPSVSVDAFAVPQELKPMAIYAYAHYLQLCGDTGRAIGLSEGAMIFMSPRLPIPCIYLSLITAVGYVSRGVWEKAEYYFRLAWELASPDRILMPFAEYRGMLSGLLEKCLRYSHPQEYKEILELSNRYQKNWVLVHNAITGDKISDKLTAIEFNVAMLASRGSSNTEISELLGISVNSVRAHMRNIFNKLGIDSRKDLRQFVL